MENVEVEHEDVAMFTSLIFGQIFLEIPDNHIESYDDFSNLFKNTWKMKKDNRMLVA